MNLEGGIALYANLFSKVAGPEDVRRSGGLSGERAESSIKIIRRRDVSLQSGDDRGLVSDSTGTWTRIRRCCDLYSQGHIWLYTH